MNKNTIQLFGSKETDEWETPDHLYNELDKEFDFTMDVAASEHNYKHPCYYTINDNALFQNWGKTVFCNPPYSKVYGFLEKAWVELKKGNTETAVFLTFANTDTKWFHKFLYHKAELRFIRGRVKFKKPGSNGNSAMRPSMVCILRRKDILDNAAI